MRFSKRFGPGNHWYDGAESNPFLVIVNIFKL